MPEIPPRPGRVYLGPAPDDEPHEGYRGLIRADELGVHIEPYATGPGVAGHAGCEYLLITKHWDPQDLGFVGASEWIPVEIPVLVPWHRVDSIEWRTDA